MDDTITGGDISAAYSASDEASPASQAPETSTPATSASADTTRPLADSQTPDVPPQTGVPPEHRWPAILENARNEWKAQYGWAAEIPRDDLDEVINLVRQSRTDPIGYVQQFIADLQADPQYGPQLRSLAARTLGAGRGQSAPPPGPLPIIQLEDGTQVDLNALKTQWQEEVDRKYAPALTAAEKLERAEEHHAAETFASDFLAEVRVLPDFRKVEPLIKADLATLIRSGKVGNHPAELENAVRKLYQKHAIPGLSANARREALTEAGQKKNANTVNPASPRTAAPAELKDLSWSDALKTAYAQAK